jgi:hypothetical protein
MGKEWRKDGIFVDEYSVSRVSISFGLYGVVFLAFLLEASYRGGPEEYGE